MALHHSVGNSGVRSGKRTSKIQFLRQYSITEPDPGTRVHVQTDSNRSGLGIGYAPDWLNTDLMANGEVVELMKDWFAQPIPIHLISPAARRHSAKLRAFGEHIVAALLLT